MKNEVKSVGGIYSYQITELYKRKFSAEEISIAKREYEEAEASEDYDFFTPETKSEKMLSLLQSILTGWEFSRVPCTITLNSPTVGRRVCTRNDTGEKIWEMGITEKVPEIIFNLKTNC